MIHIIRCTSDARIVPPALPDKFEDIVHARQDVVHEDDGIEIFVVRVSELVEWVERLVANLCKVFDTMVERSSRPR